MRTKKKFENPAKIFDPSVFVQTDTCHTCVCFGMRVKPSVIPLILDIGNSVNICADGHVSDMRAPRDVCKSVSDSIDTRRR
jgi:hypothetical protein